MYNHVQVLCVHSRARPLFIGGGGADSISLFTNTFSTSLYTIPQSTNSIQSKLFRMALYILYYKELNFSLKCLKFSQKIFFHFHSYINPLACFFLLVLVKWITQTRKIKKNIQIWFQVFSFLFFCTQHDMPCNRLVSFLPSLFWGLFNRTFV